MKNGFIAIDWGSSNCRAYKVNGEGQIVSQLSSPKGVAQISREEIPMVLGEIVRRWPDEADTIYACGMIGSTVGWESVPYISCPVLPTQFAETLPILDIGGTKINVSPGLQCESIFGQPDVMRGEEIQYLGFLYGKKDVSNVTGIVCMPGTHSKWLVVENSCAKHFSTVMTGDIFAAMSQNGLLKTHLSGQAVVCSAFFEGVDYAMKGGALGRQLFSVRSRVVLEELSESDATSYASGILIGGEINDALSTYRQWLGHVPITLIGSLDLCELYRAAIEHSGYESTILDAGQACIDGFKLINEFKGNTDGL